MGDEKVDPIEFSGKACYDDYSDDDSVQSSMETDPHWEKELDSEGEIVLSTPEFVDEDTEYDYIWSTTDEDEWVDEDNPTCGPFCCMLNLVHLACDYKFISCSIG
ncbi:unnamed protein product [Amaranthus hypochondriacus]